MICVNKLELFFAGERRQETMESIQQYPKSLWGDVAVAGPSLRSGEEKARGPRFRFSRKEVSHVK